MGAGRHGGFGQTLGCTRQSFVASRKAKLTDVSLPNNDAQIGHIFGNRPGHLPDTPKNRKRLVDLANDDSKFIGEDKYGNCWNAQIESDGSQTWVRYREGIINEGGSNTKPRVWDSDTGYNVNPFRKGNGGNKK